MSKMIRYIMLAIAISYLLFLVGHSTVNDVNPIVVIIGFTLMLIDILICALWIIKDKVVSQN